MSDLDVTDAAVLLAHARQWRVVPLIGKNPGAVLGKNWQDKGTDDPYEVLGLFSHPGITGVGIVVPDDLVVIDIDPKSGGHDTMTALEAEHGPLPTTLTVATGGHELGRHYYYRRPPGRLVGKIPRGIDVKSSGQVVAPPSVHPDTGRRYAWVDPEAPITDPPDWLVDRIVAGAAPTRPRGATPADRSAGATRRRPPGPAAKLLELDSEPYVGPRILDAVNVLDWADIWPAGWTDVTGDAESTLFDEPAELWLRPGSTSSHSAVCGAEWCHLFSTAVDGVEEGLDRGLDEGGHTKAQVYAWARGFADTTELASALVKAAKAVRP